MNQAINKTALLTERTELEMQVERFNDRMSKQPFKLVRNLLQLRVKIRLSMIDKINAQLETVPQLS